MKIYLIDPHQKWVKANLHCHTNLSDGFYSPQQIKENYQKEGYSVVAFSDHNVFYDNSDLSDDSFIALTASEYSFDDPNGKVANDTYRNKGEPLTGRDIETVHLCIYKKNPHDTYHFSTHPDNFRYETTKSGGLILDRKGHEIKYDGIKRNGSIESINQAIEAANKEGSLVQYNHPNWSLNTRETYLKLKGIWSLEIYNYLTDLETNAEYCPNIYDDMLRNGYKICCSMGDDNHNRNGSLDGSFGGFDYIGVNHLTYDEVFNSLKNKNFYASMGPIIKSLYIDTDDNKVYVECSEAINIVFTGYNRTFRYYAGENLTKADFKILGGEVYFRISVKDKFGKWANTSAYFLSDYDLKF